MLKRLLAIVLALTLSLSVSGGFAAEKTKTPAYAKKAVKARAAEAFALLEKPHAGAKEIKNFEAEDEVLVKSLGLAYSEVYVDAKTTGWVLTGYLKFADQAEEGAMLAYASYDVKNFTVTLRQKASAKSKSLGKYLSGNIFAVLEKGADEEKGYTKVAIGGKVGYVMTKLLTFTDPVEAKGYGVVQDPDKPEKKLSVMLRSQEKRNNKNVILRVKSQSAFVLIEEGEEYSKIELMGKVGFMQSKFLAIDKSIEASVQPSAESSEKTNEPTVIVLPTGGTSTEKPASPSDAPEAEDDDSPAGQDGAEGTQSPGDDG